MSNYVFISYAHKDKKAVLNSIKALSSCGVNLWYDNGIDVGDDWAGKIAEKLEKASALILFLSKHSVKSKNVLREIEFASAHSIPIITVQLYKFKLPEEIAKSLTVNQFAMLNSFKTYKTFASSLCQILNRYDVVGEVKSDYKDKKIRISGHRIFNRIVLILLCLVVILLTCKKLFILNIPTVIGMETNPAEITVNDAGFNCAVANAYSDEEEFGYIFDQNKLGTGFKNSTVVIQESLGPEIDIISIPNLVGNHISKGISMLVDAGMKTFIIEPVQTNEYELAYIAAQSIPANYKVSASNRIILSVSSSEDTVIEYNGQKIQLKDKRVEITVTDDNKLVITPLMVFGISADYKESDPLNESGSINAESRFMLSLKREDVNPFGRYRGRFVMETSMSGDDTLAWKLASMAMGGKSGKINIQLKSESFNCIAEEYDDEKFKQFVEEVTGSRDNATNYAEPIMMILGKEFVLTNMSKTARNLEWAYSLTSKFVFSIPEIQNDILKQPYSVIVQRNGKAYIALYGRDGEQRKMQFHGTIQYE